MVAALSGIPAASGLGASLLGLKNTGDLFVGVLDSETIQNRIIDKFDLRRVYRVSTYQQARKELADMSEIAEDRKSGIISVTVIDKDPERAAAIAREYVIQLDNVMTSQSTSSARRERIFLEERIKLAKQELDDATSKYAQFSSANKTIDLKEQGKALIEGAATLKGQLIAAESELSGLEQIYGPENSRVKAAQARVGRLRSELSKITGQTAQTDTDADYIAPPLSKLPVIGVEYTELYRRLQIAETVYQALIKQYEIARVEEAKELPAVKVLDEAEVPEKKVSPPRTAIAVLGTLCGLLLAMCYVVGRERFLNSHAESKQILINAWQELRNGSAPAKLQP
jgi:capsule polysaccharide export protein KpsE/RkpR